MSFYKRSYVPLWTKRENYSKSSLLKVMGAMQFISTGVEKGDKDCI